MNSSLVTSNIPVNFNFLEVIANILMSFILASVVAIVYRRTHRGLSYSQGFVISIVMLGMITSVVMMVIGNNLAKAFTLVGALSIIRFRTAVKDPRDIAYVFLVLAIGMACGTNNYYLGIISTVMISLIIALLNRINFGSITKHEYILRFLQTGEHSEEPYKETFRSYLQSSLLLNLNSVDAGRFLELSYNIKFKDNSKLTEFIKELSATQGLDNVGIISSKNDVDY